MDSVKLYHIELVRDLDVPFKSVLKIEQAAEVFHELLDRSPVEQMAVIHVDAMGNMVGVEKVGMGSLTYMVVTMAEIFRGALIASVPTIIIGHNHPPGDPTPSDADWDLTGQARRMGEKLGVNVGDHIVVAPGGKHVSMKTLDSIQSLSNMDDILNLVNKLNPEQRSVLERRAADLGFNLNEILGTVEKGNRGLHNPNFDFHDMGPRGTLGKFDHPPGPGKGLDFKFGTGPFGTDSYKTNHPEFPLQDINEDDRQPLTFVNKEHDETEREVRNAFPPGTFLGDMLSKKPKN